MPMKLEEFLKIFGGEITGDYKEIEVGVLKLRQ